MYTFNELYFDVQILPLNIYINRKRQLHIQVLARLKFERIPLEYVIKIIVIFPG